MAKRLTQQELNKELQTAILHNDQAKYKRVLAAKKMLKDLHDKYKQKQMMKEHMEKLKKKKK
jgi:hypothetical protein